MAYRLALYNFGMFRRPSDDPVNRGFHDRNDPNLRAVEASDGFISRSGYPDEPGPPSWGVQVFPRFFVDNGDGWAPSTLSLRKRGFFRPPERPQFHGRLPAPDRLNVDAPCA
ncbi:hypothetical protein Sa4125_23140 [Aureimonas sp. SA4125]|uniref:DUF3291 domain-containing protein n=1 Tax=Aureimonas sp. SA4125 TaxID=2826993 RepID=UPI001CC56209|nr:DUF3291 domain-containing protein [Aureimonas sp. SA4125]BDA84772.1 hypothetical protein Sa4125_23140 [Aureimonas sp. SA4125]